MSGLHGQRHADTERCERDHWRRTHTDEHHLPKNRRHLEHLAGKGRDEHPIKETEIKLEVILQTRRLKLLSRRMATRVEPRKPKVLKQKHPFRLRAAKGRRVRTRSGAVQSAVLIGRRLETAAL